MKICFPVQHDKGLESEVFDHFGSAPLFVVVDNQTRAVATITNQDQHHKHGACSPLRALGGKEIDAVVVRGIGGGALKRLNEMGIRVYQALTPTVVENLAMFDRLALTELSGPICGGGHGPGDPCMGHPIGGGHHHGIQGHPDGKDGPL